MTNSQNKRWKQNWVCSTCMLSDQSTQQQKSKISQSKKLSRFHITILALAADMNLGMVACQVADMTDSFQRQVLMS